MKKMTLTILLLMVFAVPGYLFAQTDNIKAANFTRIPWGVFSADMFSTAGVAWIDFNNDGKEDLFAVNDGAPCRLYMNNGDTTFTHMAAAGFENFSVPSMAASWGDYDNDGFIDVYLACKALGGPVGKRNYLFKNNGNGTFTSIDGAITEVQGWSLGCAWGDYDNDGWLDMYVANWDSANVLFKNNGNGTFSRVSNVTTAENSASYATNWVDYNNDGLQDLFVTNYFTTTFPPHKDELYRNDGNGNFTKITNNQLVNDTTMTTGASWADYDNDGNIDVFLTSYNVSTYHPGDLNIIFKNNGDGTFSKMSSLAPSLEASNTSYGSGWADWNNDGNLDLSVSNNRSGARQVFMYENNGDGTFTKITNAAPNLNADNVFGEAWGDYDNNGSPELYVGNGSSTRWNGFYRNNDTTNNWLKFRLKGVYSNRSAIGARVVVYANAKKQTRMLLGNTGMYSQSSLYPLFGLGTAVKADSVRVFWPSGRQDVYKNVNAKQFLTLTEGETVVPVELLSFTANRKNNDVEVKWTTVTEKNNKGFEVYRSKGNNEWNFVAQVNGNGTTTELKKYSVVDKNIASGKYQYKLVQIDFDGTRTDKVIEFEAGAVVTNFALSQNYPNPFNPSTTINFSVPVESKVVIRLYNILGKEVKTLMNENREEGNHSLKVDLSDLDSGIYFYQMNSGNFTQTRKLTLMK